MENELRKVGNPKGANIMYVEDYVYSFMKEIMQEKKVEVILLGKEKIEHQKHYYYVSGMVLDGDGRKYFEKAKYLGTARVIRAQDGHPFLQLDEKKSENIRFEDYYIFFEENEEMKNYMLSFPKKESKEEKREKKQNVEAGLPQIKSVVKSESVFKYVITICIMAYVIISMNHYCKLEWLGEQMIYIIYTLSSQDTFYMPR